MSDYAATRDGHLRLTILKLLAEETEYSLTESMLDELVKPFRFGVSRDKIVGELEWLAEKNLLTIEDLRGLKVATITKRGLSVAEGSIIVSGVKHPSPRS